MFLIPLSLQNISELRNPSERVPLAEQIPYEDGLHLIEDGGFQGFELYSSEGDNLMQLQVFFEDTQTKKPVTVRVVELPKAAQAVNPALSFSCSFCLSAGRQVSSCQHQWAAYVLIWQALTVSKDEIAHPELAALSAQLNTPKYLKSLEEGRDRFAEFTDVELDSVSLYLDEPPLLKGESLSQILNLEFTKYKKYDVPKEKEFLSPRLWSLPEIFRRKLMAYSEHYFNEVNKQNRMVDMVRYNFSNGMQISAQDILRHPLHRKVLLILLPQAKNPASVFAKWPLVQRNENDFVSQPMIELEEIMQGLLAQITTAHRQKKIDLYLQTKGNSTKALKITSVEFDPAQELDWRVDFIERKELITEFKLISFRKQPFHLY